MFRCSILAAFVVLTSCDGGGGDLDPETVTNLPPGDGAGAAATGTYSMETVTTSCDGDCTTTIEGFTYSACDIGTRLDDDADIVQADGALTIDIADNDYVSRLTGGIDADGTFDVGGLRTQMGGEITITARSTGSVVGDQLTGTARLEVHGSGLGCRIGVDIGGQRQ